MGRFLKTLVGIGLCASAIGMTAQADESYSNEQSVELEAPARVTYARKVPRYLREQEAQEQGQNAQNAEIPDGQRKIVAAQESGKGLNFVEVQDVEVIRVLPDDLQGRRHQKWVVQLANGKELLSVYNSDMGDRIPLKVGDNVSMGGQYIWDRGGGLIHWLHHDPKNRRPDGYVEVNGERYGEK